MPKSLQPRAGGRPKGTPSKQAILPREIEDDVRRSARPARQADVLSRLGRAIDRLERDDPRGAMPEAEQREGACPAFGIGPRGPWHVVLRRGALADAVTELKAYKRLTGMTDQNHLIADCYRALGKPEEAVPSGRRGAP